MMSSKQMVTIDGSYGEGGGQILRTALALSALTKSPLRVYNIRAGRSKPGLRPQHLTSVRGAQRVCGARLEGDRVNSTELRFFPGELSGGGFRFDISSEQPSAGAISLVLQTILPPTLFASNSSHIKILRGGTHVPFSPPVPYLEQVFVPTLSRMGAQVSLAIRKAGWYPKGGGEVEAKVEPVDNLRAVAIEERGSLRRVKCLSAISNLKRSIAERQARRCEELLSELGCKMESEIAMLPSPGEGTVVFLLAEFEECVAGFSALGEIGKPAERVAEEAVEAFRSYWNTGMPVDKNLCDQLVLYMALAKGTSRIRTSQLTRHALTNIWVVEQFLPVKFEVEGAEGQAGTVGVEGIGFSRR